MDLVLAVFTEIDGTFEIYRKIQSPNYSVIIVDYTWENRTPGKLLW